MLVFSWSSEYAIDISVGQRAEGWGSWRSLYNFEPMKLVEVLAFLRNHPVQLTLRNGTGAVIASPGACPALNLDMLKRVYPTTIFRISCRSIYSPYVQHRKCSLSSKWRTIESWFAKHIHPSDRMHYNGWHTSILTLYRYCSQGNLQVCKTWRTIELTWIELILDAHASCHHFTSCVAVSFRGSLAVPVFKWNGQVLHHEVSCPDDINQVRMPYKILLEMLPCRLPYHSDGILPPIGNTSTNRGFSSHLWFPKGRIWCWRATNRYLNTRFMMCPEKNSKQWINDSSSIISSIDLLIIYLSIYPHFQISIYPFIYLSTCMILCIPLCLVLNM